MNFSLFILLILLVLKVISGPHPKRDTNVCTEHFKEVVARGIKDEQGKPLQVKQVGNSTIIVDTNFLISLGQMNSHEARANQVSTVHHLMDYMKRMKGRGSNPELATTKVTAYETAYRDEKIPKEISLVKVSQYKQQDYDHVMAQLKTANVGGANAESLNAQNDRKIIADILFSERATNAVVPKFATRDSGIVLPLCRLNPQCLAAFENSSASSALEMITPENYQLLRKKFPYGFYVEVKDKGDVVRSIQILPL